MYLVIDTETIDEKDYVLSYVFRISKEAKEDKNKDNRRIVHVSDVYSDFYHTPSQWYVNENGYLRKNPHR